MKRDRPESPRRTGPTHVSEGFFYIVIVFPPPLLLALLLRRLDRKTGRTWTSHLACVLPWLFIDVCCGGCAAPHDIFPLPEMWFKSEAHISKIFPRIGQWCSFSAPKPVTSFQYSAPPRSGPPLDPQSARVLLNISCSSSRLATVDNAGRVNACVAGLSIRRWRTGTDVIDDIISHVIRPFEGSTSHIQAVAGLAGYLVVVNREVELIKA